MIASKQLATNIREVYLSGKWIANTNVKEVLNDVDLEMAMHSYKKLNSIAALTFHLNYYLEGLLFFIREGDLTMRDALSFSLDENLDENGWDSLKKKIIQNADEVASYIESLSQTDLEADFYMQKYGSWQRNLEGLVHHGYYHLGQMVLIKKLIQG